MKLLEEFIEAVQQRNQALDIGNAKIANRNYDKISAIRKEWEKDGIDLKELSPLLNHEDDAVKSMTAFILLPILQSEAEETLEILSTKKGQVSFEAEMTLKEWKKGNLKF